MLRDARLKGEAVPLPDIMRAGIAQHGARFNELRSRGYVIENETRRGANGDILSSYYLRFDPEQEGTH